MATGWAREGAVQEQIDDTVTDSVRRAQSRLPQGESATSCEQCGEPIPEARRAALPGVRRCIDCQQQHDQQIRHFSGYNRSGSKDSQLR